MNNLLQGYSSSEDNEEHSNDQKNNLSDNEKLNSNRVLSSNLNKKIHKKNKHLKEFYDVSNQDLKIINANEINKSNNDDLNPIKTIKKDLKNKLKPSVHQKRKHQVSFLFFYSFYIYIIDYL